LSTNITIGSRCAWWEAQTGKTCDEGAFLHGSVVFGGPIKLRLSKNKKHWHIL